MSVSILMAAVLAQAAPGVASLNVTVPTVPGAAADPTCGGRPALVTVATCVATTQAAVETVIDAWNVDFANQGWLAAGGSDNRVVYVKRRPEGGCDGFQVLAFAGNDAIAAPAAPAYLALAAIPGDVCAAQPTAPTAPAAPQ